MNLPIWYLSGMRYSKIPCADFSGTILAAGENSDYQEGDNVFGLTFIPGNAALTEVLHIKPPIGVHRDCKKPQILSHIQAASLPLVWLTASSRIKNCEPYLVENQKKIVVLGGSSAVGIYTIQLAKQRQWEVMAICSGRSSMLVRSLGADHVVDYTTGNVRKLVMNFQPHGIIDCGVERSAWELPNVMLPSWGTKQTGQSREAGWLICIVHG